MSAPRLRPRRPPADRSGPGTCRAGQAAGAIDDVGVLLVHDRRVVTDLTTCSRPCCSVVSAAFGSVLPCSIVWANWYSGWPPSTVASAANDSFFRAAIGLADRDPLLDDLHLVRFLLLELRWSTMDFSTGTATPGFCCPGLQVLAQVVLQERLRPLLRRGVGVHHEVVDEDQTGR